MLNISKYLTNGTRFLPKPSCEFICFFSSGTGKKSFDQRVKDQIFGESEMDPETPFTEQNSRNKESFLRTYRQELLKKADEKMKDSFEEDSERFAERAMKSFEGADDAKLLQLNKNIMESIRMKGNWDPSYIPGQKISDEYGKYDTYINNYAKFDNVEIDPEDDGTSHFGANVAKMIKKLRPDVEEKKGQEFAINKIKEKHGETNPFAKPLSNEEAEKLYHESLMQHEVDERNEAKAIAASAIGPPKDNAAIPDTPLIDRNVGRLSPKAKEDIFTLYLKGWSTRDLSIRFGILPERVRAVLWCQQYFYNEILPLMDLETIKMGLDLEADYGEEQPWIDYGLDITEIIQREEGVPYYKFSPNLDTKPVSPEIQAKIDALIAQKKRRHYDIVSEDFVGKGTRGYYVKNWLVYSGHGSPDPNRAFKKAVYRSHEPHTFSHKMKKNIKKGPRGAAQGFSMPK